VRVLHVAASVAPGDGGAATAILELVRHLPEAGVEVRLVVTDADGRGRLKEWQKLEVEGQYGVKIDWHRMHWPRRLKASVGLAVQLLRIGRDYDVLHIHGLYLFHTVVAAQVARVLGVSYVIQPHGGLEPYQRRRNGAVKSAFDRAGGLRALRGASAVIFTHKQEASHAASAVGSNQARVVSLGAALDLIPHGYQPPPSLARLAQAPSVVFLGRLAKKKRVDLLLSAWHCVLEEFPDAVLFLAGPADEETSHQLLSLASLLPGGSVRFLGSVSGADKAYLLKSGSCLALVSENENFAISVAEALVAGLPVVVSDQVALQDLVKREAAGVVIEELSPDVVAHALLEAIRRRAELVPGAQAAAKHLSWTSAAEATAVIYRQVVKAK